MPGKWTKFKQPVGFTASTMLLLTDATVLVHDAGAAANGTPTGINSRRIPRETTQRAHGPH
jgi:hypothetical protein